MQGKKFDGRALKEDWILMAGGEEYKGARFQTDGHQWDGRDTTLQD